MSFPRYPAYKTSGVEWLDEVPEHWEVIRLKNVLACRITDGPHTTPEFIDEGVPFLSVDGIQGGELNFEGCRYISEEDYEEYRKKARPKKDDLLMGKAASTGKIARVKTDTAFGIWSPLALIRVDSSQWSPSFYEQALKSPASQAQIEVLCTSNTQKNISMDDIPRLTLTRPSHDEQKAIANFLDRETAKIDALIAEQQRLIELLQEKRQAVISHAVTKGLNPDAPMKDSGVEWLGEVPEHWEVSRLGWIAEQVNDINHEMPEAVHSGVPFLSAKDLDNDGTMNFENDIKQISEADFIRLSQKIKPERGDIIYSRIGTIGRAALVDTDERFLVSYSCCVIRVRRQNIHLRFLRDLLASDLILTESKARTRSMGQPDLGLGEIRKFPTPIPPIEEQKAIDHYLTRKIGELDAVCSKTAACLNLLQERRSALISAAVTGQIDVRGLATEEEEA